MHRTVDRAVAILAILAVAMLLASATSMTIVRADSPVLLQQLERYLSVDGEANLWSWYSSGLLALLGAAFLLLAARSDASGRWTAGTVLGAVALVMSLDEATVLHERLRLVFSGLTTSGYAWLILGVPIAIAVAIAVLRISQALEPDLRRALVVAGGVFAAGAIGFELLGGVLGLDATSAASIALTTIEEALECAGALLALRAVASALVTGISAVTRSDERRTPSGA